MGIYLIVPSPEEIIVHPLMITLLVEWLGMGWQDALMVSLGLYRLLGIVLILGALFIGGAQILAKLKRKFKKNCKNS